MNLDPHKVRLVAPFWPSLSGRRLRFTGRRNSIQLQETALVVQGDMLRFYYLGIERFFGGVFAEWTTVTVPYSRITSARYRTHLLLRLLLLSPIVGLAILMVIGVMTGNIGAFEMGMAIVALTLPVGLLVFLILGGIASGYTVKYRARDGTRTSFSFRVRSRALRREFDAALTKYRDAAQQFRVGGRQP